MKKVEEILCEVIFKDHKSDISTSRIGKIDEFQLTNFSTSSNEFIMFKESYNSPILKKDIKEIIIYRNDRKIAIKEKDATIIKSLKIQKKGEIS
jgi:regulatory protein YycI of two-component signal transduction system YycFG